jgi:anti-anti-sigma factor
LWSARREGSVLRVRGEIDVFTADDVQERLIAGVVEGIDRVDLAEVGFFGLAGVRVLLAAAQEARARGALLEVVCPPAVLRLLEICRVADDDVWRLSPLSLSGEAPAEDGKH